MENLPNVPLLPHRALRKSNSDKLSFSDSCPLPLLICLWKISEGKKSLPTRCLGRRSNDFLHTERCTECCPVALDAKGEIRLAKTLAAAEPAVSVNWPGCTVGTPHFNGGPEYGTVDTCPPQVSHKALLLQICCLPDHLSDGLFFVYLAWSIL